MRQHVQFFRRNGQVPSVKWVNYCVLMFWVVPKDDGPSKRANMGIDLKKTMSRAAAANVSPLLSKHRKTRTTATAKATGGNLLCNQPSNTWGASMVKGGDLAGNFLCCHALYEHKTPDKRLRKEGWSCCTAQMVSPAKGRGSPSSQTNSKQFERCWSATKWEFSDMLFLVANARRTFYGFVIPSGSGWLKS